MFHFTTNPPYSNIAKAWRKDTHKIQNKKLKLKFFAFLGVDSSENGFRASFSILARRTDRTKGSNRPNG